MSLKDMVKFDDKGLIPVIAQDVYSNEILMLAYANEEALEKTVVTKKAHYYSRSRQELWLKGDTSGHYQNVRDILIDCDEDAIIYKVVQEGNACHTGEYSCFFRKYVEEELVKNEKEIDNVAILEQIFNVVTDRKNNPKEGSYTNYLFEKGIDKILKKVGEESAETIIAAKNNVKAEIQLETADLLYHLIVMLVDRGMSLEDVYGELTHRR